MFLNARSLSHALREAVARHAAAGRTALLGRAGSTSYAELGTKVDRHAAAMRGIARGELVGILASRSADSVALFFGIMQAGGCPCFVEPAPDADALVGRMDAVGVRRIVLEGEFESIAPALDQAGMQVDVLAGMPASSPAHGDCLEASLTTSDLAMMQTTSGSTGHQKGVLLTHGNLLCNADGIVARTSLTPADRLLHVMPLHHTNGVNNQLIAPLLAGASVVLVEKFRADDVEDQIAEYRVTYMTGVPTMYSRVLPHLRDSAKRRSLRFLRCGSAPITVSLHRQIEEAFGVSLVVSYGLSEATCTSTMNPPDARRVGSIGTVLRGQRVHLFKPGTNQAVSAGAEGEICIAGACLMKGYVGVGSEQPIRNGWLRTGDLGRFDADGYLAITGRITDVIIRGGENLSPQLIEGIVSQHPAVKSCCVVGGPHPDLGEVAVAFVLLHDGATPCADELQALVGVHLSRASIPTEVRFVDAFPENSVGKVDRKALARIIASYPNTDTHTPKEV